MKISFLDDEPEIFPMQYGGKARMIISLAKHFARLKDIENVTILSRSIKSNRSNFKWKGINFVKLNGYGIIKKIADESNGADVLNIHTSSFTFPYVENKKAIIVNHLHDVIFATSDTGSHLDKAIGGKWDAIITPSVFATNVLKNVTSWDNFNKKIFTIPRAIDGNTFHKVSPNIAYSKIKKFNSNLRIKQNSYPVIFFPHRVNANKGEIFLPKLCKLLSIKYPNSLILATFDGEHNFKIPNLIDLGWIPTEYMKYFYSISDLTISMSLLPESFSQVCLESIACGTPVLCFKFGNLADLSEKFPAIKSCEPNIDNIFFNIINILNNQKKVKKDIAASQTIIKKDHNLKKIAQIYLSVYKNILQNKERARYEPMSDTKKQEIRYFLSPVIATYGATAYLYENGKLQKFGLNQHEQNILSYCREAKTFKEIKSKIKLQPVKLKKIIQKLVNIKIIVKG